MNDAHCFRFADQVVVISGGTRGIGRAIAEGFVQRGAQVVLTGRTAEAAGGACPPVEFSRGPSRRLAWLVNVSAPADVERLAAQVLDQFGHVDTHRSSTWPASTAASRLWR